MLLLRSAAGASETSALLDALIRKGILTNREAEDIRAEVAQHATATPAVVRAVGHSTDRLSVGMRMQLQYENLGTDIRAGADPAPTNHFFTRRMYLTLKAGLGVRWSALFTYDFANNGYDDAVIEWKPDGDLRFDFGLRKVNVGYEERATSGDIRAIERSSVTRYFVESNNGRRLGAASYRIGAFLEGKKGALLYSAALTTPERNETFELASSAGDRTNNRLATWASVALTGKTNGGTWIAGVGAGYLPDQGGFGTANLGRGFDLSVLSLHAHVTAGRFSLMGELLGAEVKHGAASGADLQPVGFLSSRRCCLRKRSRWYCGTLFSIPTTAG